MNVDYVLEKLLLQSGVELNIQTLIYEDKVDQYSSYFMFNGYDMVYTDCKDKYNEFLMDNEMFFNMQDLTDRIIHVTSEDYMNDPEIFIHILNDFYGVDAFIEECNYQKDIDFWLDVL